MTTDAVSSEEEAAFAYLRTGSGEPWRWTEAGTVLTWTADGGTVAFRDELLSILEWLAPHGLPSFPALAMLLAACRGRTMALDALIGPAEAVMDRPGGDAAKLAAVRLQFRARCTAILDSLGALEGWPRDVLASARAKAALAEAVFERSEAWVHSPAQARAIIEGLRQGAWTEAELNRPTGRRMAAVATLQALAGLEHVDPAALDRRVRTGMEDTLAPAPLPPEAFRPPAELARQLLDQLQRDPVHAGLARAARDLLAALSLPRRLPEPDDTAMGGAADVANRGSLDKLLLSELANDDLTLAARVALNEALYLRNEPPAAAKAVSIALLLDAGVRMWGVPRLFAASAALALGAMDVRRPGLQAWRANGSKIEPVDLLSAAGFQLHLGALSTEAHPGAALPAFFSALNPPVDARGRSRRTEMEAVILTHRDALADGSFRRALDSQRVPPGVELLVASVDRDGRFELQPYPPGGKPPLCEATIRLDEIQRDPAKPAVETRRVLSPAPLLGPHSLGDLPVVLSLPRLPFLLSVRGEVSAACVAADGRTFAVSKTRCLLSWGEAKYGAAVLAAGLPPGPTLLLQPETDTGRIHILKAARHEGHLPLSTYDPESGEMRTMPLAVLKSTPVAARVQGGVILLLYPVRVDVFRLGDGEKLSSVDAPVGVRWEHGRYYKHPFAKETQWYFASWNGSVGGFSQIHGDVQAARAIFDRTGRPGPWMLTDQGEVRHVESRSSIFSLGRSLVPNQRAYVSRDGHHLHLSSKKAGVMEYIDLKNNRAYDRAVDPKLVARSGYEPFLTTPLYPALTRFSAVCVLPSGNLALRSPRGRWWEFARLEADRSGFFGLRECATPGAGCRVRPFAPVVLPGKTYYRLKEAQWPDGSRAFLDSRGLLHMKFRGSSTEFSLVLTDSHSALWANDGRMAGAAFLLGPDQIETPIDDLWPVLLQLCKVLR